MPSPSPLFRGLLLPLAVLAFCAPPAQATPSPKLTLTLPPAGADEHAPIAYAWTATRIQTGGLVIQRQQGTSHVWRTIGHLRGSSGRGELGGLPLGSYRLRLANLGPAVNHRHKLLAEQRRTLHVFGRVPLADLLGGAIGPGVYTTATGTFSYVVTGVDFGPDTETAFTIATNACRAVHLDFAVEPAVGYQQGGGTVSVLQEAADPVAASALMATTGGLDARLTPGRTWSTTVGTDLRGGARVHLNGDASCFSAGRGTVGASAGIQP